MIKRHCYLGIDYLVGTPRRLLDKFQCELIDQDWQ
jgi:hypothetical protein